MGLEQGLDSDAQIEIVGGLAVEGGGDENSRGYSATSVPARSKKTIEARKLTLRPMPQTGMMENSIAVG